MKKSPCWNLPSCKSMSSPGLSLSRCVTSQISTKDLPQLVSAPSLGSLIYESFSFTPAGVWKIFFMTLFIPIRYGSKKHHHIYLIKQIIASLSCRQILHISTLKRVPIIIYFYSIISSCSAHGYGRLVISAPQVHFFLKSIKLNSLLKFAKSIKLLLKFAGFIVSFIT